MFGPQVSIHLFIIWGMAQTRAVILTRSSIPTGISTAIRMSAPPVLTRWWIICNAGWPSDATPLFDTDWYLDCHPDVGAAGPHPLVHYLLHGTVEGCNPSRFFDGGWYLDRNTDVRAATLNPLAHYLRHGADEGREVKPLSNYQQWIETYDTLSAC